MQIKLRWNACYVRRRAFRVQTFYENNSGVSSRKFQTHFKLHENLIKLWIKKFQRAASTTILNRLSQRRTVQTKKNIM